MKSALMVIAPDQFRDEEYARPREVLEQRGARIVTASVAPGPCRGKLGMMIRADMALFDVDPVEYDAIIFVGGPGSTVFFDDEDSHRIARAVADTQGVVAAICIAPSVLARAGLLEGRTVTAFPTQEDDLRAHGASFTGAPVEVDEKIITANGPDAASEFGSEIADALGI